jgi:1,4-dihydroxy-6-naphthoate synthase
MVIRIGHSPDPDDAFMFYGLGSGRVKLENIAIEHVMEDIQSLNVRAMRGDLEVTAISAHAFPFVADKYWIMATGASMGEGYGPVIVSRKYKSLEELRGKRVATPGKLTTATLLFKIFTTGIENFDVSFDEILGEVSEGKFDAGLIIHEGQITYADQGFHKILDFGELWAKKFDKLPLPLGLDIVRKDLGETLAHQLSDGLKQSIHYGYTHQDDSVPYALKYGRGISRELGERFVKMYVSELTVDMGERGKKALDKLFNLGAQKNLIPPVPPIVLF